MTLTNLRISGECEDVLDLGDLLKVELKNDNVLVFDTKLDVKLVNTILETLYRMQLEKSDELKFVMQVYKLESIPGQAS